MRPLSHVQEYYDRGQSTFQRLVVMYLPATNVRTLLVLMIS